jgi:hypothetical protein
MAASLPAVLVMTLFFAVLFWVFIPGNLLTLPNNDHGPDDSTVKYVHALLFAIVLALSYEIVANYIYKNI